MYIIHEKRIEIVSCEKLEKYTKQKKYLYRNILRGNSGN
jgi:hypothetical protein